MKACVVISEKNIDKAIELIHKYEFCEIRLDLCQFNDDEIRIIFSQGRNLIVTFHGNEETVTERVESLKLSVESGATYVDIDYYLGKNLIIELVELAKKNNCISIISYHNYIETPDDEFLNQTILFSKQLEADIIKIATQIKIREDSFRITALYKNHQNLISFCMGNSAEARISRINSIKLGAPFCYVYDGEDKNKVADGQLSLDEFNLLFKN